MKVVNTQIAVKQLPVKQGSRGHGALKRRVSLFAVAMLASAASFAVTTTPTPPPGSVFVKDFYVDAAHTQLVGSVATGVCPQGPTPVTWGVESKYVVYRIYTCPSTVQRIPKP
jgi:hypothetical protein